MYDTSAAGLDLFGLSGSLNPAEQHRSRVTYRGLGLRLGDVFGGFECHGDNFVQI
ncbi:Uncharacterised protein [Mycobacteroides abscessus subsp. abscessus]|nr:Uncharacterised protein [Mycobacteroides abscessus subsp. abscessus]